MLKPRILFSIPLRHHVEIAVDEMYGMQELGYTCHPFFYGSKSGIVSKLGRLTVILRHAIKLIKIARRFQPDIIYLNSRVELLAGMRDVITIALFKTFYRQQVKFVLKSHGSDLELFNSDSIITRKMISYFLRKNISGWLFLSSEERNIIADSKYLPINQVFVTQNIVRINQFKADLKFKEKYGVSPHHNVLLFVGRLIKPKGIYDVINAFPLISKLHPVTLIIVGDGAEYENIKFLTRSLGVEKQVRFTGFIPEQDVIPFYANSDVLIFPTYFPEGFPMALFNAVAAGMCIATTPVRAAVDFLSEPENCLWVEAHNHTNIASVVNRLLGSASMMEKMKIANVEKGNLFNRGDVCAGLSKIIEKINLQPCN